MIEFFFVGMPIKTLGSLGKIRVGRVTGNTHIFFFGLSIENLWPTEFCHQFSFCNLVTKRSPHEGQLTTQSCCR